MKVFLIAIALTALTATAAFGQKQKQEPTDLPTPNRTAGTTQEETGKRLAADTNIQAMLESTLDVKKAKPGDSVVLKTTKSIKQNGEVIVPKGSKLVGRVTEVTRKGEGSDMSRISVIFDQLRGRGLDQPITASILSITDTRTTASVADSAMADVSGSTMTSAGASRSGGGGLLGGVGNTVGSTVGGVVNTAATTTGSVVNTAGSTVGSTVNTAGGALRGVNVSQSASGSANSSTTLSSNDKNLKLEKGVTFNMAVSAKANGSGN